MGRIKNSFLTYTTNIEDTLLRFKTFHLRRFRKIRTDKVADSSTGTSIRFVFILKHTTERFQVNNKKLIFYFFKVISHHNFVNEYGQKNLIQIKKISLPKKVRIAKMFNGRSTTT